MARTTSILTQAEVEAVSYLAALGNSLAVVTNGSGLVVSSSATATEVGYLSGVTSAIQTQLDAKPDLSDNNTWTGTNTFANIVSVTGDYAIGTASAIGYVQHSTASGLVLQGHGSANDMTFVNSAGNNVFRIVTGTTTVRFYGIVEPTTNDVATLGSGSRAWSDAFFADGAVLNFNNGNYTMTHSSSLMTFSSGISSVYSTIRNTATATFSTVSQGLTLAGNLVTSTYVSDGYTAGLVWASTDDNATKPKAAIFSRTTGSGSYVIIGTSNSYATGVTSSVAIDYNGGIECATVTSTANSMLLNPTSGNAILEIGNSTLTGTVAGIDLHFGVTGAQDYNVRLVNDADGHFTIASATGAVHFETLGRQTITTSVNDYTLNIQTGVTSSAGLLVQADSLTSGQCAYFYSDSSDTNNRNLVYIQNDNALATGARLLYLQQDANAQAMSVIASSTTTTVVKIDGDSLTTGSVLHVYSNSSDTGSRKLLQVVNDHVSASSTTTLYVQNDSTGNVATLTGGAQGGNGLFIQVDSLTTGSAIYAYSNSSSTSSRSLVNILNDNASASNTICLKVAQDANYLNTYITSTGNTTVDVFYIDANALTTGNLANYIDNSTSSSTRYTLRAINNSSSATGASPLFLGQGAVTSTNYKSFIVFDTGNKFWFANNTTPNGSLSGIAGDLCFSTNGNIYRCTGTTTWVAM